MDKRSILEASGEEQLSRVFKIDLSNQGLKEIALVKQLERLRCLVLSYNMISQIENLQVFPDLRELHIQSNELQKLGGLQGNRFLQVLNLRNNNIQKIQNLGHLFKLQTLILDFNCIAKVSGLQYLKDLKNLFISHNSIESLQNLPTFSKLTQLNISHNKIKNISPSLFSSSKSLTFLDLSHNQIQSTVFLQSMTSLEYLNLSQNSIKELQAAILPNLQFLNISQNQIEKLPIIGTCFPELISLDISNNMICSELILLQSLAETEYLTELNFKNNPMFTETFEKGIQKVHGFDFLNEKPMSKAGAKYYEKIDKIQQDLRDNRQIYEEDDEQDRKIKMSGFYDEELEFRMTGMKVNRPSSPKKRKNLDKPTFYDDIDRVYHQFSQNDLRIKVLREQYLKICGQYDIKGSQHILTQLPPETDLGKMPSQEQKIKEPEQKKELSHQFSSNQHEIKKQNEKNLNKWKELKQREKSFNIREVIKKSRGRDSSMIRGASQTTNSNWMGLKTEKQKNDLMRTQAVPRKSGEQLFKTMIRPRSTQKKG